MDHRRHRRRGFITWHSASGPDACPYGSCDPGRATTDHPWKHRIQPSRRLIHRENGGARSGLGEQRQQGLSLPR